VERREGFADVAGGRLFYEEAGSGPPVVLIHGGLWDGRMWDDQVDAFAADFRTVRYDVRGFGKSVRATEPYSPLDDWLSLLGTLGVERAALVGLSMGGSLSLEFTLARPDMVSALVLVAPGARGYADWSQEVLNVWDSSEQAVVAGDRARAQAIELDLWTPSGTDPQVDERIREIAMENLDILDEPDDLVQWDHGPPIDRLDEVQAPTLVVLGERDVPDINAIGRRATTEIAGARSHVIAGADHVPNMRSPEEFNRVVLGFLRETLSPAGS
jgi:3-oxoadipate enol-lactonase